METITNNKTQTIIAPRVQIDIYRAKIMKTSKWEGDDLKIKTLRARESYIPRYGDVDITDRFDENAAIYLVRTCYQSTEGEQIEEWLSARFVIPHLRLSMREAHELLQSLCSGRPTMSYLHKFGPYDTENIAIVSRICGYRGLQGLDGRTAEGRDFFSPLKCTAFAFVLMVGQFLTDYNSTGDIRVMLGLFRNELIRKALTITGTKRQVPRFHFGPLLLPWALRKEFRIDRNYSAYDFPSYFLNTEKLGSVLRELIISGLLPKDLVADHLSNSALIEDLLDRKVLPYYEFRGMGKLLTHQGSILGSTMCGDDLRMILDVKVPDGPELRVFKTERFSQYTTLAIKCLSNTL